MPIAQPDLAPGALEALARPAAPYVLVADDDPASLRYLTDALARLGARVEPCADGTQALAQGRRAAFDLLLLDCRMPGAGAREVLATLRNDPSASSAAAIAVATSAELDADERHALLAAGFRDTLSKPCRLDDLRQLLALARPTENGEAVLDDAQALQSSGDDAVMQALRNLLLQELDVLDHQLDQLAGDPPGFGERLHRLRASCGFCGATALATRVIALQQQIKLGIPIDAASLAPFRTTLRQTMFALQATVDG